MTATDPVGSRDLDAHRSPGFGLPGITTPTEPGGVLRLGGALRLPDADKHIDDHENWDNYYGLHAPPAPQYPNPWQQAMAGLINLADDYQRSTAAAATTGLSTQIPSLAGQVDPVITPPLYGRWHALTPQLLVDENGRPCPRRELHNWVHRLNLDPRFRVAAQLRHPGRAGPQEELMAAAWNQLGDVRGPTPSIRAAQLAREVGHCLHSKHIEPPATPPDALAADAGASGRALTLTAPAHARVVERAASGVRFGLVRSRRQLVAVGFKVAVSRVAAAPVSATMRRIVRPGARLMKALDFPEDTPADTLLARIDEQRSPPRRTVRSPRRARDPGRRRRRAAPRSRRADPVDVLPHSPDFVLRVPGDPAIPRPGDHRQR